MFIGPFKKRKILRSAEISGIDNDGDMIIFKGHLYYVEPYTGYIKHIRVASAEDYQTYISSQTSKEV